MMMRVSPTLMRDTYTYLVKLEYPCCMYFDICLLQICSLVKHNAHSNINVYVHILFKYNEKIHFQISIEVRTIKFAANVSHILNFRNIEIFNQITS